MKHPSLCIPLAAVMMAAAAPIRTPAPKTAPAAAPTTATAPGATPAPLARPLMPFDVFFEELRMQGAWIRLDDGRWAWRPTGVPRTWRPFSLGTWVFTDAGWYWLSEEPWGWATSHYGRWERREKAGWVWLPDVEWSPAWASWRQGDIALGWRPMQTAENPKSKIQNPESEIRSPQSAIEEAWTFLPWKSVSRALIPRPGAASAARQANTLEAIVASSMTAEAATPELLSQTREAADAAPDRALIEARTQRRLTACQILDTYQPRELLIVARDKTIVVAFRPVLKITAADIQKFISDRAERYKAMQERKGRGK